MLRVTLRTRWRSVRSVASASAQEPTLVEDSPNREDSMARMNPIVPCLWFDSEAEEAAKYYVGIFPNSRINTITRYGTAGNEIHKRPAGSVMTVEFELNGHPFTALNGGPHFKFNEAVSFQIKCRTQEEIDRYWE